MGEQLSESSCRTLNSNEIQPWRFMKWEPFVGNLILLAVWNKVGPAHFISHIDCVVFAWTTEFSFCRRSPQRQRRKMLSQLTTHRKISQVDLVREGKYWGLLNAKIQREKMVIWPFPWQQNTSRQSWYSRIAWISLPFSSLDCFFPGDGLKLGGGVRHSYDWCHDECQDKLHTLFWSLLVRGSAA